MARDLDFLFTFKRVDDAEDQFVGLGDDGLGIDVRTWLKALVDGADQGPGLVEHGGGLVEQLAEVGGLGVFAGQAKDVVHALGCLAIIRMVDDVLFHFFLKLLDIVIQCIAGNVLDYFAKDGDRFGVQVDFLEIGIQVSIQGHDRPVRRLPGHVQHIAGVHQFLADRISDNPVQLAPAWLLGGLRPGDFHRIPLRGIALDLTGDQVRRVPADGRTGADKLVVADQILRKGAHLDLDQVVVGSLERTQGFVQHDLAEDGAGLLPGAGTYVHPFKEIGIAGIGLDFGLGCRAGERQGGLYFAGYVLELDQLADLAKVLQVFVGEIEHGDAVAKGATANIKDDVLLLRGGHGRQPLQRIGLIEFNAQSPGRFQDLFKFLLVLITIACHQYSPLRIDRGAPQVLPCFAA